MGRQFRRKVKKHDSDREIPFPLTKKTHPSPSPNSPFPNIEKLQTTIGNQGVQRLFKSGVIQAKLRIGKPGDIYEKEADRVADQVMRMSDTAIQPKRV